MHRAREHGLAVGDTGKGYGVEHAERVERVAFVLGARDGGVEKVQIEMRVVADQDRALAVVFAHGGAHGKSSPANSMAEWSETTARAGYFTLSIAHPQRDHASRQRLCNSIGIPDDATCRIFKFLNWDRPHDIRAVLNEMERVAGC